MSGAVIAAFVCAIAEYRAFPPDDKESPAPASTTSGNNDRDFGHPDIFEMEEPISEYGSDNSGRIRTMTDEEARLLINHDRQT